VYVTSQTATNGRHCQQNKIFRTGIILFMFSLHVILRAHFPPQKLRDLHFVNGGDKDLLRKRIESYSIVWPSYRISLTTHHIAIEVYRGIRN